jgi:hypothetical protein
MASIGWKYPLILGLMMGLAAADAFTAERTGALEGPKLKLCDFQDDTKTYDIDDLLL